MIVAVVSPVDYDTRDVNPEPRAFRSFPCVDRRVVLHQEVHRAAAYPGRGGVHNHHKPRMYRDAARRSWCRGFLLAAAGVSRA